MERVSLTLRRRQSEERPPGEPRSVGYLYLAPAFLVFAGFVLVPLVHAAWLSLFEWDGLTPGHVGGAATTTATWCRTRRCGGRSATRWS